MSNKRQQTMAKMTRERTVREKRAKKLEKKQAARAEKKARAAGEWPLEESVEEPVEGHELAQEDAESSATEIESLHAAPAGEPLTESAED